MVEHQTRFQKVTFSLSNILMVIVSIFVVAICIFVWQVVRTFDSGASELRSAAIQIVKENQIDDEPLVFHTVVTSKGASCVQNPEIDKCLKGSNVERAQLVCYLSKVHDNAGVYSDSSASLEIYGNYQNCRLIEKIQWRILGD